MNEEEKFVIKTLKDSQNAYIENTKVKKVELSTDEAKVVLNLIEKQSKEIEELKKYEEGYKLLSYSLDNYTSNDKIKAKIEEIDEVLKGQLIEKIRAYFEAQKEVLQSLLEKE